MFKKNYVEKKGKVNYNVSSKIDTGLNREENLYSNYMSPEPLSTAHNSRPITSNVKYILIILIFF
jgi:hypothetical protein